MRIYVFAISSLDTTGRVYMSYDAAVCHSCDYLYISLRLRYLWSSHPQAESKCRIQNATRSLIS